MNILRLIADLLHLLSFCVIIYKLHKHKNCRGVSSKTQEIYLIVFCTRYLDLLMYYVSLYNTSMKVAFIFVTIYIIYLMRFKSPISSTYNRAEDVFPHFYLIPFALVFALLIHTAFDWWELTWSFSLWLESVAIIPQITILVKAVKVEPFTAHYIAALGSYRFFYILNWIYRYHYENYLCWTSILSGILQVLLYADFFYLYLKKYVYFFITLFSIKQSFESDLPTKAVAEKNMD